MDRFSARAEAYASARPSYPIETLTILREQHGLAAEGVVADVGSGTGIFTRLLLTTGTFVYAVEPNEDMRKEAERETGAHARFRSVPATAESTTLDDASVDLVTAAQAFHWFDLEAFNRELRRILRPGGHCALLWNDRDLDGTPLLREYESILVELCPGYGELQGKSDTPLKFDRIFGAGKWTRHAVSNEQRLNRELLVARVRSSSYAPAEGSAENTQLVAALHDVFDRYAESGEVVLRYTTVIIGGPLP